MPPAISDEELSDNELSVPLTSVKKADRAKKSMAYKEDTMDEDEEFLDGKDDTNGHAPGQEDEEDEEEGDDDEEPEEYVVEKILSHQFQAGVIKFEVKWEGYEKKSDRTWEPEDNLRENASVILDEYYESVGGREKVFNDMKNALKTKKRGRSTANNTPTAGNKRARKSADHPADTSPPASVKQAAWKPPAGSWEDEIASLDACEDEVEGKLMVYLTWKNGHRTQHETKVIYKRCPQKMLQFYERHVRIIKKDQEEPVATSPAD